MDIQQKFAANLKLLIQNDGRTVSAIALAIGIPQQTLQRYLHCERMVSVPNLVKIAKFFDESIDYLLDLKDD